MTRNKQDTHCCHEIGVTLGFLEDGDDQNVAELIKRISVAVQELGLDKNLINLRAQYHLRKHHCADDNEYVKYMNTKPVFNTSGFEGSFTVSKTDKPGS